MQGPLSLGYRTDLAIAALDGEVAREAGAWCARAASVPLFWWGNFLVFDAPPSAADAGEGGPWERAFDAAFRGVPGVRHRNLAWDVAPTAGALPTSPVDDDALAPFLARGYELLTSVVLVCDAPRAAERRHATAVVRPIRGDAEWDQVLAIQHASMPSQRASPTFRRYQAEQCARDRRLVAAGHGQWFGAFVPGRAEVAACMGLYVFPDGTARCQAVATAPEFRRQGLCARLVEEVTRTGLSELGAERVVMLTGPGGAAERVYRSVGFEPHERVASVARAF